MNKFAIRLLTLAIYATALVAIPTVTPAAADGSQQVRKHKKAHKSLRIGEPKASNQAPYSNPGDNPDRKVSY